MKLLFPDFNVDLGDRVTTPGSRPSTTTTTVPSSNGGSTAPTTTVAPPPAGSSAQDLLTRAEQLFAEADAALAKSPPDFATYQQKQAQARELLQRAVAELD